MSCLGERELKRITQSLFTGINFVHFGSCCIDFLPIRCISNILKGMVLMSSESEIQQVEAGQSKSVASRLVPILVIAVVVGLIIYFDLDDYLSFEALRENRQFLLEWYANNTVLMALAFCALYITVVTLSLPGATSMTLAGGFIFGTVEGTLYVVSSATIGAILIFLIARYSLADFFRSRSGPFLHKMEDGFQKNALSYLLVLRLVPLFPFWVVNLVPALLGVKTRIFAIGTFFGIIPGSAVYCSVGSGLGAVFDAGTEPDLGIILKPEILTPIIALAVLSLVPVFYKAVKSGKNPSE